MYALLYFPAAYWHVLLTLRFGREREIFARGLTMLEKRGAHVNVALVQWVMSVSLALFCYIHTCKR